MVEHRHHRAEDQLAELVQELLDAHADTVCLVEPTPASLRWAAHVEYLRDLQRVGKERLAQLRSARTGSGSGSGARPMRQLEG